MFSWKAAGRVFIAKTVCKKEVWSSHFQLFLISNGFQVSLARLIRRSPGRLGSVSCNNKRCIQSAG
jgi:hypothetical protein